MNKIDLLSFESAIYILHPKAQKPEFLMVFSIEKLWISESMYFHFLDGWLQKL